MLEIGWLIVIVAYRQAEDQRKRVGHISCIIRDILEVMSKGIGYK